METALAKQSFRLEQCLDRVVDNRGKTPPLSESGIELLEVNAITDGRKSPAFENVRKYVSKETYATWFRSGHPRRGDTLISTVGAIGRVAYVNEERGCIAQNVVALRAKPNILNGEFLYYYLASTDTQNRLLSLNIGVAQPSLKVPHLLSLAVDLPPLPIQHRIAGILSAYDDLIENCQRRIQILEEMARSLYREWFVYFRYPGHESVPLVPSALGEIPRGWEISSVEQSFQVSGGGTPSRKEQKYWENGSIQWYSPSDLTGAGTFFMDDSTDHITDDGLAQSSARLFQPFCVMLTSRATIGAVAINTTEACTNQGFITCIPNDRVPLYFLCNWVKDNVPKFQRLASGSTFKEISRGVFKKIEFIQPPQPLVNKFESLLEPVGAQLLTLQRKIKNLRETRDLLLPRLMSGQLEVTVD